MARKKPKKPLEVALKWAGDPRKATDALAQVAGTVTNPGKDPAYNVVLTAAGPLAGVDSADLPTIDVIKGGQTYQLEATVHLSTGVDNAPETPTAAAVAHGAED